MALERVFLEMGAGNDLQGGDYTKAALRAVQDALHHSSIGFVRVLGLERKAMQVEVIIGVQQPEAVDAERVRTSLPHGEVTVRVQPGGMDVPNPDTDSTTVVASAALIVRLDMP